MTFFFITSLTTVSERSSLLTPSLHSSYINWDIGVESLKMTTSLALKAVQSSTTTTDDDEDLREIMTQSVTRKKLLLANVVEQTMKN